MTTVVEICNQALSLVGTESRILGINDSTNEGKQCRTHYDQVRRSLLEDNDWQFARTQSDMALSTQGVADYDYVYQMPPNCIVMREVRAPTELVSAYGANLALSADGAPEPFEVRRILGQSYVVTDVEEAVGFFTQDVTQAGLYPPSFVEAMVTKLAMKIAMPISRKRTILEDATNAHRVAMEAALRSNAITQVKKDYKPINASWVNQR